MARKALFKSVEALIEGYGLIAKRGTRKVYLVGRPLRKEIVNENGDRVAVDVGVSLVRYASTGSGKERRKRVSTGVILKIETSEAVKRENEEKYNAQRVECDALNTDLIRLDANFRPAPKNKVLLIDYVDKVANKALRDTGNKRSMYATLGSLKKHIGIFDKDARMGKLDRQWCLRFIDYLKHGALNLNYLRTDDERRKELPLSQNSQNRLIRNLNYVLNEAVKEKVIVANSMSLLDRKEKIKYKPGTRSFLTEDEVKKLMATPFNHGSHPVKEAFLFSVFTGLRYSDLTRICKKDFRRDDIGTYLSIKMVKTKEPLKIYVPASALKLIPNTANENKPLFYLGRNETANKCLKKWLTDAGITDRPITFHSARHSAATLLLNAGLPLEVVAKQLGHEKISTTQIYAKILDKSQQAASNVIDEMFG
ncbi:MAG: site-specific integrase [Prevotella sp.]|nr:site-specific integrase [Prevotella sp.]